MHLAQSFRRHYGCPAGAYVRRLRIELACRLLAESRMSVGRIAIEAGFADHSHLTRAFRAHTGVTPSAYRRMPRG